MERFNWVRRAGDVKIGGGDASVNEITIGNVEFSYGHRNNDIRRIFRKNNQLMNFGLINH